MSVLAVRGFGTSAMGIILALKAARLIFYRIGSKGILVAVIRVLSNRRMFLSAVTDSINMGLTLLIPMLLDYILLMRGPGDEALRRV